MSTQNKENTAIITINISNKETTLGFFEEGELAHTCDLSTPDYLTVDEGRMALENFLADQGSPADVNAPKDAIMSSVVPDLTEVWESALRHFCGRRPLVVGPGLKTGIKMCYRDLMEMGSDRVADVCAALQRHEAPMVVVNLGSITSIDVVDNNGTFIGGIITPGVELSAKALAETAARLPHIQLKCPASVIGASTQEAMQVGVVVGQVACLEGLIQRIESQMGYGVKLVLTGPHAANLAPLLRREFMRDHALTLHGLYRLYTLNRPR